MTKYVFGGMREFESYGNRYANVYVFEEITGNEGFGYKPVAVQAFRKETGPDGKEKYSAYTAYTGTFKLNLSNDRQLEVYRAIKHSAFGDPSSALKPCFPVFTSGGQLHRLLEVDPDTGEVI